MTPKEIDDFVAGLISTVCDDKRTCGKCPLRVKNNDRDCASYLIGLIRNADWEGAGYVNEPDGTYERKYLECSR